MILRAASIICDRDSRLLSFDAPLLPLPAGTAASQGKPCTEVALHSLKVPFASRPVARAGAVQGHDAPAPVLWQAGQGRAGQAGRAAPQPTNRR